ncbi:MAG: hypothetical protein ACT4P6_13850 [Gemmatimonadaceae bacterium]
MRRFRIFSLAVLGLAALGACEADGGIAGPNRGAPFVFGGPSATVADTAVVGTWSRSVNSIDAAGNVRIIETVWTFNADGSALRSTIIRDALGGVLDRQDALARWTVRADQLLVDFTAPITGRVPMPFQRQGETLILSGQTFVRLV